MKSQNVDTSFLRAKEKCESLGTHGNLALRALFFGPRWPRVSGNEIGERLPHTIFHQNFKMFRLCDIEAKFVHYFDAEAV